MEISYPKCLQVEDNVTTRLWHARLGHVSIGVLNNMSKKEMALGLPCVPYEKNICDACLAGKQKRVRFRSKQRFVHHKY
uniref:GAG-pre-integrase domain-containing protein n=1 Tax=Noccaea caerulescens TaxID=107243 RepID=A0A1J3FMD6_NOCCA